MKRPSKLTLWRLTWETVAVSAALLHMVVHFDTTVDIIHGVQHFALKKSKTMVWSQFGKCIKKCKSETSRDTKACETVKTQQGLSLCANFCSVNLRLMLCNWDSAGSSPLVTSPPPAVRNFSATAVMSPAQLSLSSREQASKKWSVPFFVWSLNTNYEYITEEVDGFSLWLFPEDSINNNKFFLKLVNDGAQVVTEQWPEAIHFLIGVVSADKNKNRGNTEAWQIDNEICVCVHVANM